MIREKIVIFGTGKGGRRTYYHLLKYFKQCEVVAFWDNDSSKEGTFLFEVPVMLPRENWENVDRILICSVHYQKIYKQLTEELRISKEKISNSLYYDKVDLLEFYREKKVDNELQVVLDYLEENELTVFNYSFKKKYNTMEVDLIKDESKGMYYVLHNKRKMYFKKSMNYGEIVNYYRNICEEQDIESPHNYLMKEIEIQPKSIIIDAGAAEGNLTLSIIDKVSKAYLVESDLEWVEALQETFKGLEEKVEIIPLFLNDFNDDSNITIDNIIKNQQINLIKLDIEGAEEKALLGAAKTIDRVQNLTILACAYHNQDDAKRLSALLHSSQMKTGCSKGYIFFPYEQASGMTSYTPQLRRGLIIGKKGKDEEQYM